MFYETLSESYIYNDSGTSEGTQIKYVRDGYWYKKDSRGHEGLTEYLYDSERDCFKPAPIFDQGVSLLTCNQSVNKNFSIAENVKRVIARPFSGSHKRMTDYFGKGFALDKKAALCWLDKEEDSYEKKILEYQLKNIIV